MSEDNKTLYLRMAEKIWNKGDVDAIGEFFAPDVVIHGAPPEWPSGTDGVKATVSTYRGAMSGFELQTEFLLADGDKVAVYWTMRGTHSGELMGVPATGKQIDTYGMSVVRIEHGRVAEIWSASDQLGLMRQLGALPA